MGLRSLIQGFFGNPNPSSTVTVSNAPTTPMPVVKQTSYSPFPQQSYAPLAGSGTQGTIGNNTRNLFTQGQQVLQSGPGRITNGLATTAKWALPAFDAVKGFSNAMQYGDLQEECVRQGAKIGGFALGSSIGNAISKSGGKWGTVIKAGCAIGGWLFGGQVGEKVAGKALGDIQYEAQKNVKIGQISSGTNVELSKMNNEVVMAQMGYYNTIPGYNNMALGGMYGYGAYGMGMGYGSSPYGYINPLRAF